MSRDITTIDEYRAAMLDPVEVRARAMIVLYGRGNVPDHEPKPSRATWPDAPMFTPSPAPAPVWICRPPDWSPDWTVEHAPWRGPWTFGAHRYRSSTGRMIGGRATFHGRLNWAASRALYDAWRDADTKARQAHEAELRQIAHATRTAMLDHLRPHCVMVRALRDGRPHGPEIPALRRTVRYFLTWSWKSGNRQGRPWDEEVEAWLLFDRDWMSGAWSPGWMTLDDFAKGWRVVEPATPATP